MVENVWSKNYEGIRIVNRFLERIDDLKMPVKPTVSGTDEQLIRTRERMKGEAFFLRPNSFLSSNPTLSELPLYCSGRRLAAESQSAIICFMQSSYEARVAC